jgi:hypothetical protein
MAISWIGVAFSYPAACSPCFTRPSNLKLSKLIFYPFLLPAVERDMNPVRTGTAGKDLPFHALKKRLKDPSRTRH